MKHLDKIIISFLSLIALYHVIVVRWVFWNEWISSMSLALVRDWLRALLVLIVAFNVERKKIESFFEDRWYELLLLLLLLIWAVWFSWYKWSSLFDILIWYKYDIHYLFITFSAVFVWYVALKHKKKDTKQIWEIIYRFLALVIITWAVYQWIKMMMPDLFLRFWYWPIWDYFVWSNPPLRYRTWPWGLPRLQWLFSWPNNYGYFLAWMFSFILIRSRHIWREDKENRYLVAWIWALYVMSLLFTLSRWAFVAVFFQLLVLWLISFKKLVKSKTWSLLFWIAWLWVLFSLVVWLSYVKAWSTAWHLSARVQWWEAFISQPMWYWLWTSWPSVHYEWIYMPESQFLQIMIDIGIVWMLLWILCRKVLLTPSLKHLLTEKSIRDLPLFTLLGLGIFWLMIEWFFLHVWEDSMVNYMLLISFGILLWMSRESSDIF